MDTMYPDVLYVTPDDWGDTLIDTECGMLRVIDELRDIGPDWADIDISDCIELVKTDCNAGEYQCYRDSRGRIYKITKNRYEFENGHYEEYDICREERSR